MSKRLCKVYRSRKQEGMYLYVDHADDLRRVPEPLLQRFGEPELTLTFALSADKKLARVSAAALLEALAEKGFYLQLPPPAEDAMRAVHEKNSKIERR